MNHKHVARTFLNWFANESEEFSAVGTVHYAQGTDFVERYTNCQTGRTCNAMDYVRELANARLTMQKDVDAVIDAAQKLLRPSP